MAKELLKESATVLAEKVQQSLMPQLNARLDALERQISELRTHVDEKFERSQETMNELGIKINVVGAKLDVYMDVTKTTQSDIHKFIERVVRLEEAQKSKRRRAS